MLRTGINTIEPDFFNDFFTNIFESIKSTKSDFRSYTSKVKKSKFETNVEQAIRRLKNAPCLDCYDMCIKIFIESLSFFCYHFII